MCKYNQRARQLQVDIFVSEVRLPSPCREDCVYWMTGDNVQSSNRSNLPEFVHTAAPAGLTRPRPWLCSVSTRRLDEIFSDWKWEENDSDISQCAHWLKHWTDCSLCMGVHKGNSNYRVRPSYSKFLHFIASSPQQDSHCEAGLVRFEVELTLPSGTSVNQSRRFQRLVKALSHFFKFFFFLFA